MSTYVDHLPNVFPHKAVGTPTDVRRWVAHLLDEDRTDVPQGSSFAVTVDNWNGTWNLWMSQASAKFLKLEFPHDPKVPTPETRYLEDGSRPRGWTRPGGKWNATLKVPCPTCGAIEGQFCRVVKPQAGSFAQDTRDQGRRGAFRANQPHSARILDAVRKRREEETAS